MANPFEVRVPNVLEALMLGQQSYKDARNQSALSEAGQALQGGNQQDAIAKLLAAGNVQGALAISNLGNQQWDRQFRQTEAERAQKNTDRSYALQEAQLKEKPSYQTLEDASGNKRLIRINPLGGAIEDVTPKSLGGEGPNPFAMGGKMTEAQSKDALYTSRMINAEGILRDPAVVNAALSSKEAMKGAFANKVPFGLATNVASPEYQKYDQAKRDFINAVLRRESGAVISPSEFENAEKQYFPVPNDSPERIKQKQANREEAIRGIGAGAGPSYRPPPNQLGLTPAAQRTQAPATPQGPVKINSAAERDALPPGTPYIAPDGSLRTKQ